MEIILKQDIKGLGYRNDVVKVRDGYGRNYLIPQGFAIQATDSNRKIVAENVKQAAHKAEKIRQAAEDLATSIGDLVIEIKTKAGETGKIFGAVTAIQVAEMLKAKGFDIDRRQISLPAEVKHLGDYVATLDLHRNVKKELQFKVVEE